MRLKGLAATLTVLTVAACSSQPREPSANAPAAAAPPVANNLAPAAAPAGAADPAKPSAQGPVLNRKLVAAGYRATTIKGEVYYCRTVDVTNTNFKSKVCLNEAQLREEDRKTQEMQDRMILDQRSPGCLGPTCAGD